jgi:hypothetical protein
MKALPDYLGLVLASEKELARNLTSMAERHGSDFEIHHGCKLFAQWSQAQVGAVEAFTARYGAAINSDPVRLGRALFDASRKGGYGLLRDLQDLLLLAHQTRAAWTGLGQAAKEIHDAAMAQTALHAGARTDRQVDWLCTHIKNASPQALTVPVDTVEHVKRYPSAARQIVMAALLLGAAGLVFRLARPRWQRSPGRLKVFSV